MRLHRFIGTFDLSVKRVIVRDAGLANQLAQVLRLGTGDAVILCDGRGQDALASIVSLGKAEMIFEVQEVHPSVAEPAARVTLYAALLKRENFELIVEKAVEAGVTEIVPVVTSRTIKHGLRADRLAKIAREAAEQSGRGIVPVIAEPLKLAAAFERAAQGGQCVFDLGGEPAAAAFAGLSPSDIALFIGPEGGWEPEERAEAERRGCRVLGLGARTLRAETAAIVAVYLAANASPTRV